MKPAELGGNPSRIRLTKDVIFIAGMMFACVLLAGMLTGFVQLPFISGLPPVALLAMVAFLAVTPLLLSRWRLAFWGLIAWLMVEDLIRKFSGNNLAVYFLKDVVYIILIVGIVVSGEAQGAWRAATGRARSALYVLMTWALILSVPAVFIAWTLPLVGLRADFLYVPMVVVGFVYVRTRDDLRTFIFGLAIILAGTSLVGIIQGIIGPSFLAPDVNTPGLFNLVTVRGLSLGQKVFRPTGTFVDPGRFASMALVGVAVSLAAFALTRHTQRVISVACLILCSGGIWVSGGRSPLVIAIGLVLIAFLTVRAEGGRRSVIQASAVALAILIVAVLMMVLLPGIFASRLDWYSKTLTPGSKNSEWTTRWTNYSEAIAIGLKGGGILGTGTGMESVGKPYLLNNGNPTQEGQYTVESGYAAVAVEWGAIGLVLWVVWVVAWNSRLFWCVRKTRAGPMRTASAVLVGWMFIFVVILFFAGIAAFQNYIANFFFWTLSGIVFAVPAASWRSDTSEDLPLVEVEARAA